MTRLVFLIALLFPVAAAAQVGPEVYRPATPAQVLGYAGVAKTATQPMVNRIVRLTCTTNCYIWINASGQSLVPTATTGVYLPANIPETFIANPGSKISVIQDSSSGNLHILELTK